MDQLPIVLCGSLSLHPVITGALMHEAGYRALGLPFRYVPFRATTRSLPASVAALRALEVRGCGISMPFKQDVMDHLDELDATARSIGAVNTVVNEGGRLVGYNTDWLGSIRALEELLGVMALSTQRVLVMGGGGAARAIVFGLIKAGARVTIANRDSHRADALRDEFNAESSGGLELLGDLRPFDVVINATTVGAHACADRVPLPIKNLGRATVVMDIVYDPPETPLLQMARSLGCPTIGGFRMLLHQAAAQFELYTGHAAPLDVMEQALGARPQSKSLQPSVFSNKPSERSV